MGYEIQISEVGVPEYPLMAVLRETIFTECGHGAMTSLEADLEGRTDVHAVIAHLEGNPLGYKVGYRFAPGVYYSKSGGVFKEYRRQGLARRMQQMQHEFARSRGCHTVFFTSFNRFKPMLRFGLQSGFLPSGVERAQSGELEIKFAKELARDEEPRDGQEALAPEEVHVESIGPNFHGLVADISTRGGETIAEEEIDRELAGAIDGLAIAAFVAGKPAGFATGAGADGRKRRWNCHRLGVTAHWRGRGVESALLSHLADATRSMGYAAIRQYARQDDLPTMLAALEQDYNFTGMLHDADATRPTFLLDRSLGRSSLPG